MSGLGRIYDTVYAGLCGQHPNYRPWHFQWLFLRQAHRWQKARSRSLQGWVLDVGCGDKPYESWVDSDRVTRYVGVDISPDSRADVVAGAGGWPFADASFDATVFTQVLEHVSERDALIGEMVRVLKPGGRVLLTVPFLYPAHGLPHDHARFTLQGVQALLVAHGLRIDEAITAGGGGTTLVTLLLTWIENNLNCSLVRRLLKGVLLPLWVPFSLVMNMLGLLGDHWDRSGSHYSNVCLMATKL